MVPLPRALSGFTILLLVGTHARAAFAGSPDCAGVSIEAAGELDGDVRGAIDGREDLDTCARVIVRPIATGYLVRIELADGRATSRSVSRREDVVPTVQALLLVPRPPRETAPTTEPSPTSVTPDPPSPPSPPDEEHRAPETAVTSRWAIAPLGRPPAERPTMAIAADSSQRLRVELSVLSGARIGDDYGSVGLGVLSFAEITGWLAGFGGRVDRGQGMHTDHGQNTAATLSLLGGRRFRTPSLTFDLYGGPGVALRGTQSDVERVNVNGRDVAITEIERDSGGLARMLVGARVNFRARSILRTFVGLDGDFGARGAGANSPLADQRLPAWSVGFALGATVGTL